MRRTKIVCTLGPASNNREIIEKMLRAGMNVARFNFSHGTHQSHKEHIELFRSVRDKMGIAAAVMLDTKGPEIRLGNFSEKSVVLNDGDCFTLTTDEKYIDCGNEKIAYQTYNKLPCYLKMGALVLIDDGRVLLRVTDCTENEVHTVVIHGGEVSNHKGINIPRVALHMEYLSEKDKNDLLFAIENDVDFIAASFVRSADDVMDMRKFLDYHGGHSIKIIAKIENMEGIENFDSILESADGIMVARGDMGVEVEFERLPGLQKLFIKKCYQAGKMVITATQMLESMINNPLPTRAEISDVANAVFDGTSAVMLSGESAMGKYPDTAVEVMAKIATQAEKDAFEMDAYKNMKYVSEADSTNAICDAACTTAKDMRAEAVIAVTKYGQTARRMSKFRPSVPIVAATPEIKTFHQLSLSWGVYPVLAIRQNDTDSLFLHAVDCAKQIDVVKDGDTVVIAAGIPLDTPGSTNMLKVVRVGQLR